MHSSSLTFALALAAGMVAQIAARHARIPGIVVLIAAGVALGPDGAGVVRPETLGKALPAVVSFAVAVILFEGGLNLNVGQIRREGLVIRRLLTFGALLAASGGTVAAHLALRWSWELSAVFGTLLVVTGPTVVQPLLRRIHVDRTIATILEAEAVFVDAIGAILAVIAVEVAVNATDIRLGPVRLATRLGLGLMLGLGGGGIIALVFRFRRWVPEGLHNVTALALAVSLFQGSNAVLPESGMAAVIVAGMVVGNLEPRLWRDLRDFKEQLTILLIGLLFVLLAADVRLAEVRALGIPGLLLALATMFVIRPTSVLIATRGSGLDWRQRAFIAWIGPRGIVAAAIASVFARELMAHGVERGHELQAMTFLVIALTVVAAGLTGPPVAALLGQKAPHDHGWIILGANSLARLFARTLREAGEPVECVDANPEACRRAARDGIDVIYGNGLEERVLTRAAVGSRRGIVALTPNDAVNYLFLQKVHELERGPQLYLALETLEHGVTLGMLESLGAHLLFQRTSDVERWARLVRTETVELQLWRFDSGQTESRNAQVDPQLERHPDRGVLLLMLYRRKGATYPIAHDTQLHSDDEVFVLVNAERRSEAQERLEAHGFSPMARSISAGAATG